MTQRNKILRHIVIVLLFSVYPPLAASSPVPVVSGVMQKGFPAQADDLSKTTDALLDEYEKKGNVTSLVFYSYGLLRLAEHYSSVSQFIKASEYAKTGFFYLDEAVDLHEDDPRVRYLRAKIDAYLPAELGRCVVTLADTDKLLSSPTLLPADVKENVRYMRYRALFNCQKTEQAADLLTQLNQHTDPASPWPSARTPLTAEWDMNEVTRILQPLVKGE